ncbi:hypothetical protein C9374_004773 [Naegleria lovaniensis]|uniref:Uncharacterized protein n=1 Tax=Naegleria lovaniensis TaxID=51637 RepID=A0AA88KNN9_NAELO|nr:uncharacterized protein C9374_004773 [Naegleria lovaniensis]KAG2382806.1 hypothetical protein C9374_004773 [Naegleria lovaniensis]
MLRRVHSFLARSTSFKSHPFIHQRYNYSFPVNSQERFDPLLFSNHHDDTTTIFKTSCLKRAQFHTNFLKRYSSSVGDNGTSDHDESVLLENNSAVNIQKIREEQQTKILLSKQNSQSLRETFSARPSYSYSKEEMDQFSSTFMELALTQISLDDLDSSLENVEFCLNRLYGHIDGSSNNELHLLEKKIQFMEMKGFLLVSKEQLQEAKNAFEEIIKLEPNHYLAWFHLADLNCSMSRFDTALECCKKAVEIHNNMTPNSKEKLHEDLQPHWTSLFHNLGEYEKRDEKIQEMYHKYHAGEFGPICTTPSMTNVWQFPKLEGHFVRDAFRVHDCKKLQDFGVNANSIQVLVFEFYDLIGEHTVKYVFVCYDEQNDKEFRFSLGSYKSTWDVVKEIREKDGIPMSPNERTFHLDCYHENGHVGYGFCSGPIEGPLPFYDKVKNGVIEILKEGDHGFDLEVAVHGGTSTK